jgi:hypothetical protein
MTRTSPFLADKTTSQAGLPMFPQARALRPRGRPLAKIAAVSAVVVVLPLVPVTATTSSVRLKARLVSTSLKTGIPAASRRAMTGALRGMPGLLTVKPAFSTRSECPEPSQIRPLGRRVSALTTAAFRVSLAKTVKPLARSRRAAASPDLPRPRTQARWRLNLAGSKAWPLI